jgi:hypothetical protein
VIIAAALCPAPPLLMPGLTGGEPVLPELRQACQAAVAELAAAGPDLVAVVGSAPVSRIWDGEQLDAAAFAPGLAGPAETTAPDWPGVPCAPGAPGGLPLPLPLGIGCWLLDQAGHSGERLLQSVGYDEPASRCAQIGAGLATVAARRVGLLVMADGSACRGPKAPGYLDHRSIAFDAEVERAVRTGDLAALLAVDPGLATELLATGRAPWQVLSGALNGNQVATEIRYCDDPFGVSYLVASLRVRVIGEGAESG